MDGTEHTMSCSPSPRILLPADEATTRQICQRRDLTVTQRDVDMLTPARPAPRQQSGHDTITSIQPRRQICHRNANLYRRPIPTASDVHESHLGLDHDIVSRTCGIGSCLSVAGDGGVDETRIDFRERSIVHAVLCEGSRKVVLHDDVAVRGEFVEDRDA